MMVKLKQLSLKRSSTIYRKESMFLTEFVNIYGAKGLAWVKVVEDGLTGPIGRFFETENVETLLTLTGAEACNFIMFLTENKPNVLIKFRCITCQIS